MYKKSLPYLIAFVVLGFLSAFALYKRTPGGEDTANLGVTIAHLAFLKQLANNSSNLVADTVDTISNLPAQTGTPSHDTPLSSGDPRIRGGVNMKGGGGEGGSSYYRS